MGTRGTNTQTEVLQGILGEIAQAKLAPDADIEWLLGIETQILQKLREPIDQAMQNSGLNGMPPPGQSAAPADPMAGMIPGAGPSQPAPGVPGIRTSPSAPNPDELRRLLTNSPG